MKAFIVQKIVIKIMTNNKTVLKSNEWLALKRAVCVRDGMFSRRSRRAFFPVV